jgi:NADPH:quinone reductase-like Zn-dependent oxidoreductase
MLHGEGEEGAPRFESYTFTDISPSFFEKAKEKFSHALDYMNFKVLEIENDPAEQGFEYGTYDVVIAANALHATESIDRTLTNVRKLLKPGGKLVLFETTSLLSWHRFFGLLPGWWLSVEPHRKWGALMDVPSWTSHLDDNGFSGLDMCFKDFEGELVQSTVMVSTASGGESKSENSPNVVIIRSADSESLGFAQKLDESVSKAGVSEIQIVSVEDLVQFDFTQKVCIFLPELESSLLLGLNQNQHSWLQRMTSTAQGLLWLTQGGGRSPSNPLAEMVTGFARTIRIENPTLKFITLNFESSPGIESDLSITMEIFDSIFLHQNPQTIDNTFTAINGIIHIPRVLEANYMNKAIVTKTRRPTPELARLGDQSGRALKFVHGSIGVLDNMYLADDPEHGEPLGDGEVELRIMASGLNFRDVLVVLGQINLDAVGIEGAGIVTRTGPNTTFQVGDHVCGMVSGGMNTFARAHETTIIKLPEQMSFVSAAALSIVFMTAYSALYEIADIQKGETVLIHAAAGGVGQACIQLALLRGAEVYATVGSKEKAELLQNQYGIPQDHILSSRDLTFAQGIQRLTSGRGVDVVVNSLSGEALQASWDCIAPCGRFVEIGKIDIYSSARLNMEKFKYNVRFQCLDVAFMGSSEPLRFKRTLEAVMRLYQEGSISDLRSIQVFSFGQFQDAFHLMQSGRHTGKIVLEPHADDQVRVSNPLRIIAIVTDRLLTFVSDCSPSWLRLHLRSTCHLCDLGRSWWNRAEHRKVVREARRSESNPPLKIRCRPEKCETIGSRSHCVRRSHCDASLRCV